MKKKLMMRMVPAFMFFLLCSGCGMEENIVINPDLSSSITLKSYTTDEEEVMISQELEGVTYQQMMKEPVLSVPEKRNCTARSIMYTSL